VEQSTGHRGEKGEEIARKGSLREKGGMPGGEIKLAIWALAHGGISERKKIGTSR